MAYEVPPPENVVHLPVVRRGGRIGTVVAFWEVEPVSADSEDFSPASGNITFYDNQVGTRLLSFVLLAFLFLIYFILYNQFSFSNFYFHMICVSFYLGV